MDLTSGIMDPRIQALIKPAMVDPGTPPGLTSTIAAPSAPAPYISNAMPVTQTGLDQQRLNSTVNSGSGVSQIQNPLLRGIARAGDIAASVFAPRIAAVLPGTTLHHNLLVGQQQQQLANDEANDQQQAQTANLDAQPQLKQQAAALAQEKQNNTESHQQDLLAQQKDHQQQQYIQNLRDHGFAPDETDPTGKAVRPLKYEEMSPTQQAVTDLKGSQDELAQARTEMAKAQNDPNSPAYQIAAKRVAVAETNAQTARGRLGLQGQQFEMRAHGTQNGVALPGSMIDDNGNTIGTAFQQNVRPTGTERNKGDMAASAAQQLSDLKAIVQKNPTMFGPGYGQSTAFKQWVGAQSPDAQRFVAARTIAGDHLAGTFGGRSEAALTALDNAIGQFKDNPQAAMAGIDQLAGANGLFQGRGTVRTTGSKAGAAPVPAAPSTAEVWTRDASGKLVKK